MNNDNVENLTDNTDASQPIGEQQPVAEVQSGDKNTKKKGSKGVIILFVLLFLIGFAGGIFYYFSTKDTESAKVNTDTKKYSSEYRIGSNGLENFDLYFLKLENEEKNKVYSPLSIKYALEMLGEGASGESKKQIDAVIGDYKAKNYPNSEHMSFANAMFIRNTFKDNILEDYTSNLATKYGAEILYDEFSSAQPMNNWVKQKTFNLISDFFEDAKVTQEDFILTNALAIDMNWNNAIHCAVGGVAPCINNSGYYTIAYAHEKLDDNDNSENYHVIEYPYVGEEAFFGNDYSLNEYQNAKNEFNGKEHTKGATVLADFNKYDIIKDLGEDKIREIVRAEYEAWLKTSEGKEADRGAFPTNVDAYVNTFISELKSNYGTGATSTDFLLYEDENVKEFAKDLKEYDGVTLQYVGIMPKNEKLTDFVKSTDKDSLNKLIDSLKEVKIDNFEEGYATRIRGFIPFFKFEYELQLMADLKKLGISDVFDSKKANLSGMLKNADGEYIGEASHKATIEFSNDGIKAAAVTSFGGWGSAHGPYFEHLFKVPVKDIDISFNKPYMYIVRDKNSGEVWFTGTVYEGITK